MACPGWASSYRSPNKHGTVLRKFCHHYVLKKQRGKHYYAQAAGGGRRGKVAKVRKLVGGGPTAQEKPYINSIVTSRSTGARHSVLRSLFLPAFFLSFFSSKSTSPDFFFLLPFFFSSPPSPLLFLSDFFFPPFFSPPPAPSPSSPSANGLSVTISAVGSTAAPDCAHWSQTPWQRGRRSGAKRWADLFRLAGALPGLLQQLLQAARSTCVMPTLQQTARGQLDAVAPVHLLFGFVDLGLQHSDLVVALDPLAASGGDVFVDPPCAQTTVT